MRVMLWSLYAAGLFCCPLLATADQLDHELSWVEAGYRVDDFDAFAEPANSPALRGSWHIGEGFSLYAESASGSFDLPGEPDYVLNALGLGLSESVSNHVYGTLSGVIFVHEVGTATDKYGRIRYSIHGNTDGGLAWSIGIQSLFSADLYKGTGLYLGGEFRFTDNVALSLEANGYDGLTSYQAGMRWYFD